MADSLSDIRLQAEQKARVMIERQLTEAGWLVQDKPDGWRRTNLR